MIFLDFIDTDICDTIKNTIIGKARKRVLFFTFCQSMMHVTPYFGVATNRSLRA